MERTNHSEQLFGYANQLQVEKDAGESELSPAYYKQMAADQGYALRLVIAHGVACIVEAIEKLTNAIYDEGQRRG